MRSSMKKVVVAVTTLSLLAGVGASVALADRPDLEPYTFCHKPGTPAEKTMTLPKVAYDRGHSNHGDTPDPCQDDNGGGGEDPGEDPDGLCEAVLDHLTELAPDEIAALLLAVADVDLDLGDIEIADALAVIALGLDIDLEDLLEEITDGVCDVLHLVLHIKHKVLGVAFFATGGVLHLAGHVTHKALHVVGDVVELATDDVVAGVFVGADAAVFSILDLDADLSAGAFLGLL